MEIRAGIDIGSVTTKCVIVKGTEIAGKSIMKTGIDTEKCALAVMERAIEEAGIKNYDINTVISTGYGRRLLKKSDRVITEISAAASGGYNLAGRGECLIIDVGGQDTKVIEVNGGGNVLDFLMNDKCAAGTGRFLEIMAEVMETDLPGFSSLAMTSKTPVKINSTCSVFAESEVISLIASSAAREDIAAGLFKSIAARVAGMIRQFSQHQLTLFCGGGAKSPALKQAIEKAIEREITVLPEPQFVVAYGAAITDLTDSRLNPYKNKTGREI